MTGNARAEGKAGTSAAHPQHVADHQIQSDTATDAFRSVAERVASHPLSVAFAIVLAGVVGILGDRYAPIILPPRLWLLHPPLHLGATAFWILLAISGGFGWMQGLGVVRTAQRSALVRKERENLLRELADDTHRTAERQAETVKQVGELRERFIESEAERKRQSLDRHPTHRALAALTITHGYQHAAFREFLKNERRLPPEHRDMAAEEVRTRIRQVLNTVVTLIARIEDVPADRVLAANVMRVFSTAMLADSDDSEVRKSLEEWGYDDLRDMEHILVLDPRLSFSTVSDTDAPDAHLPSLILPVPRELTSVGADGASLLNVMPGAPEAVMRRAVWAGDVRSLVEKCRDKTTRKLPDKLADVLSRYFEGPAHMVKSFVSFPVMRDAGHFPRAVLNVHLNQDGLLIDDGRREATLRVLQPTYHILIDMLGSLDLLHRPAFLADLGS